MPLLKWLKWPKVAAGEWLLCRGSAQRKSKRERNRKRGREGVQWGDLIWREEACWPCSSAAQAIFMQFAFEFELCVVTFSSCSIVRAEYFHLQVECFSNDYLNGI